ncbi:MAG: hypothetical protein DI539_19685 [Flavobacterium psychrophilum]|nr:MAG: hypothetical protein DI539_19685 [Flavobacterium psychrophilum]
MKQLYFILLFSVSNLFAQKIPWKTDLKLSSGTKYIHVIDPYNGKNDEYFFDKEGKLEKVISNSGLIIDYKEVYRSQFFYKDSLLIRRENFYNDKLRDVTKYEYENGNLILETDFDVEENLMTSQISYCYLQGKLSSKLKVEKDGIDVTEIEYSDWGSVSETKEYYEDDQLMGVIVETIVNDTVVWEEYGISKGDRILADRKKYVYDEKKNIIEYCYLYDYGEGLYGCHRYSYADNIITNAKYFNNKEEVWMEEFYDNKGNIIKEVRPKVEWQTEEEITTFKNYYNKRGDLIKVKRNKGRARIAKFKIKYW